METALGVVAGKGGVDVLDFLGFAVRREVSDECRPAVNPMVKGWLYSLNPAFMKASYDEGTPYDAWVAEQKRKLGDNVSLTPIPSTELAGIEALFTIVEKARQTAEDKETETEEALAARQAAESEARTLAPFKKKAEDLEKKAAQLEEKNAALTAEVKELKGKLAAFDGKVAVDEADLEKSVKDIVSKAVKASLSGLVAAGGVAADTSATDNASVAAEPADDAGGGVPDTFGFGTSGANNDGFGF
jgi:predicted ribosome quality control (RQC) complex YloA/Tae2 family protein